MHKLVREGKVSIHYVKSEDQLANIGIKYLSNHLHRNIIKLINELQASNANTLINYQGKAIIFLRRNTCVLLTKFRALRSYLQRSTYTALLFHSRY